MAAQSTTLDPFAGPIDAEVRPPGSKSIAARALITAALAEGSSILDGFGLCEDTERLLAGLEALGIPLAVDAQDSRVEVTGCGGHLPAEEAEIDCGESGTMLRFCTALAALGTGRFRLTGSARLCERPLGPLIDGLRQLGGAVECAVHEDHAPIIVHGRGLRGGHARIDGSTSSQYASALMLCAPVMRGDLLLELTGKVVSRPYLALTAEVMRAFGVELVSSDDTRFVVPAPQAYVACNYAIEPDASSASYFLAAAAICGGRVRVHGLGSGALQGDVKALDLLGRMGCAIQWSTDHVELIRDPASDLHGLDADLGDTPDIVPTLAVCALFADGPTALRNIAHLQLKESRRLDVVAEGVSRLGGVVETTADALHIVPPPSTRSARIATAGDHRMAMAFALAGLRQPGVIIEDPACVSKSFPSFFPMLKSLETGGNRAS